MNISKIDKKCKVCGATFAPKTVKSIYCSRKCGETAYKRKVAAQEREEQLKAVADGVSDSRMYISVTEAVAIFGVARTTLYRLIRQGRISALNLGTRLVRIDRMELEKSFPKRQTKLDRGTKPSTKLYNLEPEECYTIGEIAKKFGISESSVFKHIRQYSIPTRQIGRFVYAPKSEIENLYKG